MNSLGDVDIFSLNTLIKNFNCKLSAISENDSSKQILCLISEDNEILLRYLNGCLGVDSAKHISWFKKSNRVIHDICFDPSGSWLLVLCFDNTLHIIPALKIVDDSQMPPDIFSSTEITSFVIPFAGPHECPNSKNCPNSENISTLVSINQLDDIVDQQASVKDGYKFSLTELDQKECTEDGFFNDTKRNSSNESSESFCSSSTCPYPTSTVWWTTLRLDLDLRHRAIIGYSDGSICFVGLTPNCPFISAVSIENGSVARLVMCQDNNHENVTLLINSSSKEQWKLLLEQKSVRYTFPGDIVRKSNEFSDSGIDDWEIITPPKTNESHIVATSSSVLPFGQPMKGDPEGKTFLVQTNDDLNTELRSGILPTAKAKFASLKDLSSKKFSALRMKLADNKSKSDNVNSSNSFAILESPSTTPEILTAQNTGTYFAVQNLRNRFLLSALHIYSDTLSVHSMDISLIPLFLYKLPKNCQEVLITSNILYTIQHIEADTIDKDVEVKSTINSIGIISSAMGSMKNGEEIDFNKKSLLRLFKFPDEKIINVHRMGIFPTKDNRQINKEESSDTLNTSDIKSTTSYIRLYKNLEKNEFGLQNDSQIMVEKFPDFNYDPCIVVTNKNCYFIDFCQKPSMIFLNAAIAGSWNICEDFCRTFDLSFTQCIEFAGDCLLRKKKVTQALLTYNVGRIPPVRTALKLAMYGENYALMHLCAMALKMLYILKSKYPSRFCIQFLLHDQKFRHAENLANIVKKIEKDDKSVIIESKLCSDYAYGLDDTTGSLQMSASSQFHLSNLLVITLSERAVREQNYIPLWNFLMTNTKYHTNMTSIVLCQSGLFSAALLLAMARGAHIDVFMGMVAVSSQKFGWYSEINLLLYNLSESIFCECITYLRNVSVDYFAMLQNKIGCIEKNVLERLERQLNPFSAVYRPILSTCLSENLQENNERHTKDLFEISKLHIETYLAILIQLETLKKDQGNVIHALNNFHINYEKNQFAINTRIFLPISAGCSHASCVIDGVAYFWGSNGVSCVYTAKKSTDYPDPPHAVKCLELLSELNIEVHAVKCGRQHSLILTNNGLYAFGSNQQGQLGIGKSRLLSLQPTLVTTLDNMNITILEAGQYHNAAVADKKLFVWGWGTYGQLGLGSIENVYLPKEISFFRTKNVIQISLGHAHSLVLCKTQSGCAELYVFGSNHFGQLGLGGRQYEPVTDHSKNSSHMKYLIPTKLDFDNGNIRLIHTKFFTNLAVNDRNELFTWGASPQALRLANQIRRRASAKQKIEENIKREILKREIENKDGICDVLSSQKFSQQKEKNLSRKYSSSSLLVSNTDIESQHIEKHHRSHSEPKEITSFEIQNNSSTNDKYIERLEKEKKFVSKNSTDDLPTKISETPKSAKRSVTVDEETNEHLYPMKVDTSEVSGDIIQISSGLFHFALISSTSVLYTWGKNLEHQLGTEDRERRNLPKPSALDAIDDPLYVDCGADFTIVMTKDFVVKAFGGNTNGQCGKELKSKLPGKFFCLPTTKRIMRLDGHCVEHPNVVNLPRPRIKMGSEPIRYMKTFPHFVSSFLVKSNIFEGFAYGREEHQSYTHGCYMEMDDIASSNENLSINDGESIDSSIVRLKTSSSCDIPQDVDSTETVVNTIGNNNIVFKNYSREYIHYCLYIFHGLYEPKFFQFHDNTLDFHIRVLMVNYKYIDAFNLCLKECQSAQKSLKFFEYFTKDPNIVPIKRSDFKFFIYQLFLHFLHQKFDLIECETFFLNDIDYYLSELSYVIYFNNNNTELEQCLNSKFKDIYFQNFTKNDDENHFEFRLQDISLIFDSLSVKFKAILCQKIMKICENVHVIQ